MAVSICLGFTAAANAQTNFQFSADAYGTYANLGKIVVAGKTSVSSLGHCGTVDPPPPAGSSHKAGWAAQICAAPTDIAGKGVPQVQS